MEKKYNSLFLKKTNNYLSLLWLVFGFLAGFQHLHAQEPDFAWVKRFGTNSQLAYGPAVTVDNQGNSYAVGMYLSSQFNLDGTIFQPGSTENINGYIAKYDQDGNLAWAVPTLETLAVAGTVSPPNIDKIIVDATGNVYVTGEYGSGLYSTIGSTVLSTYNAQYQTDRNYFLVKLSAGGAVQWVKTTSRSPYGYAGLPVYNDIHFDLAGNINMTGYFRESITFSPDHMLTHQADEGAVFLTKYSPQGEIMLCRKLEGAVSPPLPITGSYSEQVKPDGSGNLLRWSNGASGKKIYLYDSEGELVNSKTIDISYVINFTEYDPPLEGFAVDSQGNVFISGYFYGFLLLDGEQYNGFGNVQKTDAVLIKLSSQDFDVDWVHIPQQSLSEDFTKLLTDGVGNVYAAGQINGAGENKMFIEKINGQGEVLWQKTIAGVYSSAHPLGGIFPLSICQANDGGNLWISGTFSRNAYFDATAHFITSSLNHFNGFLVQYGTCNVEKPTITTPETTQICTGETIDLSANFSNPNLSYRWNTGQTTPTITVDHAGIYYVVAQEGEECYGKSQEIWITEKALPDNTVNFESGVLSAVVADATYQWINCDTQSAIVGALGQNFTPVVAGTYAVEITNTAGCTNTSECLTVTEAELGVDGHYLPENNIMLYPNPASEKITLQTAAQIEKVSVVNMLGQKVLKVNNEKQIDISKLSPGHYILIAETVNGQWRGKFIKK